MHNISLKEIITVLKNHLKDDGIFKVIDESELHAGHLETKGAKGVTHIAIWITWKEFQHLSILKRHQIVNTWLEPFFKKGLHAARYILKMPGEH